MNLTKLFNVSYFLQNLKKSKAMIMLLMLLVPLFTSLALITSNQNVWEFQELSGINMIGMYIIPVALSIELFSFVHKKSSADFMGSMPISRKCIFYTNTLGGMLLLTLIQLLTMVCTLFLARILGDIIIFTSMVWDIFVFFTVAYIFVFTVANLAMTFSGNRISQIVSSMLIIFLIPFLIGTGKLYYENNNPSKYIEKTNLEIEDNFHFTAPNFIIDYVITGKYFTYDSISVNKMLILSVIYIALGVFLFEKKKLEMAGESYETRNIHLGVKLLTLIPFMFLFCGFATDDSEEVCVFLFAIMAVYYFVFDLITNKKINWKASIAMFFVSIAVIYFYYVGFTSHFDLVNTEVELQTTEIESILVEGIDVTWRDERPFYLSITEENMIQYLVGKMINSSASNLYYDIGIQPVETETVNESIKVIDDINLIGENVKLKIRLKNGKEYSLREYWNAEIWKKIFTTYGTQEFNRNLTNMRLSIENLQLTLKEEKEILEILNSQMNQMTYQEIWQLYQKNTDGGRYYEYITLYDYCEHEFQCYYIPYSFSNELWQKIIEMNKQEAIRKIDRIESIFSADDEKLFEYLASYCEKNNIQLFYEQNGTQFQTIEDFYYSYGDEVVDEIKEWIRNDAKKPFEIDKDYLVLKSNYPVYIKYYTNDIDGICKIYVEKYQEICARMKE